MMYYTCPHCGSNLDRRERCDCQEETAKIKKAASKEDDPTTTTLYTNRICAVNHTARKD